MQKEGQPPAFFIHGAGAGSASEDPLRRTVRKDGEVLSGRACAYTDRSFVGGAQQDRTRPLYRELTTATASGSAKIFLWRDRKPGEKSAAE